MQLKERLEKFYIIYNHTRIHGSICNLPPIIFKLLWQGKKVKCIKNKKRNSIKFKLQMPIYEVNKYLKERKIKKNDIGQWEQERA